MHIKRHAHKMGMKKVEIHENNKNHLTDFIRLNEEWITQYFALEKADRTLTANPSIVMDNQGYLFSLVHDNMVVGVTQEPQHHRLCWGSHTHPNLPATTIDVIVIALNCAPFFCVKHDNK